MAQLRHFRHDAGDERVSPARAYVRPLIIRSSSALLAIPSFS